MIAYRYMSKHARPSTDGVSTVAPITAESQHYENRSSSKSKLTLLGDIISKLRLMEEPMAMLDMV